MNNINTDCYCDENTLKTCENCEKSYAEKEKLDNEASFLIGEIGRFGDMFKNYFEDCDFETCKYILKNVKSHTNKLFKLTRSKKEIVEN